MNIGERILKLRKEKGLSQEELGSVLGVSRQTVSKWETGESNPDLDKIIPMCDLFEIKADELLRGEEFTDNEIQEINDKEFEYKKVKKYEPLVVAGSILLYFIAVVWIMVASSFSMISDEIMVSIFLIIVAIPTCLLIYYYISLDNKKKYLKDSSIEKIKKEKSKYKEIDDILALLFVIIYLYISFVTGGWFITWILWIVYELVIKVVHLILDMKRGGKDE